MRKNKLAIRLLLLVLVLGLIPTVYAYMFRKISPGTITLKPAEISCEVREVFNRDADRKESVKIANTGNKAAYIRVRLVFNWQDSKGNVVGRSSPEHNKLKINTDYWVALGDDTYCYKLPVNSGASTENLLKEPFQMEGVSQEENHIVYTYHPVMEVVAEAIQSDPVDAVQQAWKVTMSGNTITGKSTN